MNADWRARYELAVELAEKASQLAMSYFDNPLEVLFKEDNSPVTVADRKAEELIRNGIEHYFPADGLLGEEYGAAESQSGYRWVIDPIDGTKSFVRGVPIWGTLVGIEYQSEQIAGVVAAPAIGQHYRALRGDGAYRNNRKIEVSQVSEIGSAMVCYSSVNWFMKNGKEQNFLNLVKQTERQRGYGDFYGFLLVAQGSAEMMIEHGVNPWDVVALKAIIEEAGGTFTDWTGKPTAYTPDAVATNGKLHSTCLEIINR